MLHFLSVAVLLGAMAERVKVVQTLRKGAKAHQVPLVPDNAGRERVICKEALSRLMSSRCVQRRSGAISTEPERIFAGKPYAV